MSSAGVSGWAAGGQGRGSFGRLSTLDIPGQTTDGHRQTRLVTPLSFLFTNLIVFLLVT